MNEAAVVGAVDKLISDNTQTLLGGLSKQGQPRTKLQITQSTLTPAKEFFYLAIDVTEVSEMTLTDRNAANKQFLLPGLREVRYTVSVGITDDAYVQLGEDQPYEKLHTDFRLFTDRVIHLLENTAWITGLESQKYQLFRPTSGQDRSFRKRNLSGTYDDQAGQEHYLFYTQIEFVLVEKCPEPDRLYD